MNWWEDVEAADNRHKTCHFPKHGGELWVDVVAEDRQYVEWLTSGDVTAPELDDLLYEYLMSLLEGDEEDF